MRILNLDTKFGAENSQRLNSAKTERSWS